MRHITIRSILPEAQNKILFEGSFPCEKICLEHAVADHVDLTGADLRKLNLSNAALDDAKLARADFSHSNLSGANLSECTLESAQLLGTSLYNSCFAYSGLRGCDFSGAFFGGTDINGANIGHAQFSTLSAFDLDFAMTTNMDGCAFINPDGHYCAMSKPPVVIKNLLPKPLILLDRSVKYGHEILPPRALKAGPLGRLVHDIRILQKSADTGADGIASAV